MVARNNKRTQRVNKNSSTNVLKRKSRARPIDPQLVMFNKPFNTLSQFSGEQGDSTLADFIDMKHIYPAGRLDKDSEGLMLLTDDGIIQHKIAHPSKKMNKTYWAQLEGDISDQALDRLSNGVELKDGITKPAIAERLSEPFRFTLWERTPAIRKRSNIPTSWLSLTICEGKNRQVRRMTAAVGFPTLRLIRVAIGPWHIDGLQPGEFRSLAVPPNLRSA
jgi:23S rRNA pseudouridine2457 synthase